MVDILQSADISKTAVVPQEAFAGRWRMRTRVQRVWGVSHATWFTLMGLGGGLFILARLLNLSHDLGLWFGLPAVDIVSFVVIAIGGLILLADLGKPFRFLRALLNVRTSWISRGAVADFVFLILGALLVLPNLKIGGAMPFAALPWQSEAINGAGRTLEVISILAAVVVTFYAGSVLAAPKSIPYWNSPLVPAQFLLSSAAMSMGVLSFFFLGVGKGASAGYVALQILFIGLLLVTILWHLMTNKDAPGKSDSLSILLRGEYKGLFVGGVIVLGTVAPLALSVAALAVVAGGVREGMLAAGGCLLIVQGFILRLLTLRVGIYPPVR